MTAVQIGATGEAAVAAAFLRHGVPVFLPVGDAGIDLIADFGPRPQRIQVKSSAAAADSISFRLGRRPTIRGADAASQPTWRAYPPGLVDWFALYSLAHDRVALIPGDYSSLTANVVFAAPGEDSAAYHKRRTLFIEQCELGTVLARVYDNLLTASVNEQIEP